MISPRSSEQLQFSNVTNYLGYRLLTNMGMRLTRRSIDGETETGSVSFATMYAGLELGHRRELEWRYTMRTFSFFYGALGSLALLLISTGCEPQDENPTVAEVGDQTITVTGRAGTSSPNCPSTPRAKRPGRSR